MSGAKPRYHVSFYDAASDEELGLLLTENGGAIGRVAQLASPWAAKVAGGPRTLTDLTDLSTYEQSDWQGGRGQDRFSEEDQFLDSRGAETRIEGQITLGPLSIATGIAGGTYYMPTAIQDQVIGKLSSSKQARSQSFTCPGGGLDCTHVIVRVAKSATVTGTWVVALVADVAGLPNGAVLRTFSITDAMLSTTYQDLTCTWATMYTLVAATVYHIALYPPAPLSDVGYLKWASDTAGSYAGTPSYQQRVWTVGATAVGAADPIDLDVWAADSGYDLWFRVNNAPGLAGDITVNPVRFGANLYCAADDTVYVWTTATQVWTVSEHVHGQTVTALAVWGDHLWAARGENTMRRLTAALAWGDAPGTVQANLLAEYQGYLYRTSAAVPSDLYYTADGTTWAGPGHIGPGDWPATGMAGFRDQFTIVNTVGVWVISADWSYQVLDWKSLEEANNGRGSLSWAKRSEMFIPVGYGVYRWTGASMVSCGPDQGTGIPAARAGKITAMCGTVNWLFAALDAGGNGASAVLAYDGKGWHEIVRGQAAGRRIRALGYDTLSSPHRLWYGEGDTMYYVELPDYSDNPYTYTGIRYCSDGEVTLSSWGSELAAVTKDWRAVVVQSEGCTAGRPIELFYEIDRSDIWRSLGSVADRATLHTLSFPVASFQTKECAAGCTMTAITIAGVGTGTGDMVVGDCVRIRDEVRMVYSIGSSTQFTLHAPLSAAPAAGAKIYPSSPASTEIRLKVRLATDTVTASPKLLGLALYCNASPADRWQITLSIRIEDAMSDLAGGDYPWNAATLAAELERWIARPTPFTLLDIYSMERLVKVTNAVVSNSARKTSVPSGYDSVARLSLLEVDVGGSPGEPAPTSEPPPEGEGE